ncbi:hypothetical protein CPB85DRAFT_1311761 [Mucidula mucida]|nr:hypothetical protein CPB85DRAFT_1311761 [Mucidula mucida]
MNVHTSQITPSRPSYAAATAILSLGSRESSRGCSERGSVQHSDGTRALNFLNDDEVTPGYVASRSATPRAADAELSHARDRIATLSAENQELRRESKELRRQLSRVSHSSGAWDRLRRYFNVPAGYDDDALISKLDKYKSDNRSLRQHLTDLEHSSQSHITQLEKDVWAERALRQSSQDLLHVRTQELNDAQMYLSKADSISIEDLKETTKSLNSEIFQTAAFMTDTLDFSKPSAAIDEAIVQRATQWLSRGLVDLLMNDQDPDTREILITAGIQASFVQSCVAIVQVWGVDYQVSASIASLYDQIRLSNSPSVAGRWRAMTRHQSKYVHADECKRLAAEALIDNLLPVLPLMGWSAANPKADLQESFGRRIADMANLVVSLDRSIGEEMISEDIKLAMVHYGDPADDKLMEDLYGTKRFRQRETVVCTCELGLYNGRIESGDAGSTVEQVLLKPKVVLLSALKPVRGVKSKK